MLASGYYLLDHEMRTSRYSPLLILTAIACTACLPVSGTYLRPNVDGAEYRQLQCGNPPEIAYFPLETIYVALLVDPINRWNRGVLLTFHVPKGETIQLTERTVTIHTKSAVDERRAVVEFVHPDWAKDRDYLSVLPGDTHIHRTIFGPNDFHYRTYSLNAIMDFSGVESGDVKLPNLLINGKAIEGPVVPFMRTKYSTFSPVNGC